MTDRKITHRQLMALVFVSLLSPMIRSVPNGEIPIAGKAAWLAPFAALLPLLALYGVFRLFLKHRTGEIGLGDVMLRAFGPVFGRVMLIAFALWLDVCTGIVLRTAGERLVSYVYNDMSWVVFAAVILVSAWIAALGTPRSLARTAQILVPVAGTVLIAVFLLLAGDIDPGRFLPVTYLDIPRAALAGLRLTAALSVYGFYTFLYGNVDQNSSKGGVIYLFYLLFVAAGVSVSAIGVLSAPIADTMQSPFFVVIRNITFLNILERIEAVVIVLWVISDFMFVSSMLTASSELLVLTFGGKGRRLSVSASAAPAMAAAVLSAESAFELKNTVLNTVPIINAALVFGVIPLSILAARLKRRL